MAAKKTKKKSAATPKKKAAAAAKKAAAPKKKAATAKKTAAAAPKKKAAAAAVAKKTAAAPKKAAAAPKNAAVAPKNAAVAPKKTAAAPKKTAAAAVAKKPAAAPKPSTSPVAICWARIEEWFAKNHPTLSLGLRPGASAKDIAAAEKKLGVAFPEDFRASLLVHDGQEDSPGVRIVPMAQRLASLEAFVTCWTDDRSAYDEKAMAERFDWLDESERVRQVHFHPKHIPIAGSPFWDYDRLLLDFIPGPQGTSGQVIVRDDIDFAFLCTSFGELLAKIADGLENGTVVVSKTTYDAELEYRAPNATKPISEYKFFG